MRHHDPGLHRDAAVDDSVELRDQALLALPPVRTFGTMLPVDRERAAREHDVPGRGIPELLRRDPLGEEAGRPPFAGRLAGGSRSMSFRLVCHSVAGDGVKAPLF